MNTKNLMLFGMAIAMSTSVANAQKWSMSNGNMFDALSSKSDRAVYVGIGVAPSTSYRLNVAGSTYLQSSTKVGGSLTVNGSTFVSALTASSNLYTKKNLTVDGTTYLNGLSTFVGKVTMPAGFSATGPCSVSSTLSVGNATTLNSTLKVNGQSTLTGNVGIGVAADANRKLYVKGYTVLQGQTSVDVTNSNFLLTTAGVNGLRISYSTENGFNTNLIESRVQSTNQNLAFKAQSFQFRYGNVSLDKSLNVGQNLDVKGKITCHNEIEVTAMNAGTINAKDINVELTHAADYVFDEEYSLKPLSEVEGYVKANKHLPGVPSAAEIAENGMSVSKMSNLLLEKIEELTLHMIELQKENQSLKAEIESLKK